MREALPNCTLVAFSPFFSICKSQEGRDRNGKKGAFVETKKILVIMAAIENSDMTGLLHIRGTGIIIPLLVRDCGSEQRGQFTQSSKSQSCILELSKFKATMLSVSETPRFLNFEHW